MHPKPILRIHQTRKDLSAGIVRGQHGEYVWKVFCTNDVAAFDALVPIADIGRWTRRDKPMRLQWPQLGLEQPRFGAVVSKLQQVRNFETLSTSTVIEHSPYVGHGEREKSSGEGNVGRKDHNSCVDALGYSRVS